MPGERAKIAVESYDDRIDPVGACVGVKEAVCTASCVSCAVRTSTDQLHAEHLAVHYPCVEPGRGEQRAYPRRGHKAEVYLNPDQVSLAIGKSGLNIKLASMLTEYTIDVFREIEGAEGEGDDIYLDEFVGDIDQWIIDALKRSVWKRQKTY